MNVYKINVLHRPYMVDYRNLTVYGNYKGLKQMHKKFIIIWKPKN